MSIRIYISHVPRLQLAFQGCKLKRGRAWYVNNVQYVIVWSKIMNVGGLTTRFRPRGRSLKKGLEQG